MKKTIPEGDVEIVQDLFEELQAIPSYAERFDRSATVRMVVMVYCESCQTWHNADDGCSKLVAA